MCEFSRVWGANVLCRPAPTKRVSRLVFGLWPTQPDTRLVGVPTDRHGRLTHFLPPTQLRHRHISKGRRCHKDHIMASWHFFTKTAAGKIRYCKRLLSHTGQEQACTRITWLFVGHHAKNGPIHRKMVVIVPLVVTFKTT